MRTVLKLLAGAVFAPALLLAGVGIAGVVRGHVNEVASIGHHLAQGVPGFERLFRGRRHFHQVDVKMCEAGVRHR